MLIKKLAPVLLTLGLHVVRLDATTITPITPMSFPAVTITPLSFPGVKRPPLIVPAKLPGAPSPLPAPSPAALLPEKALPESLIRVRAVRPELLFDGRIERTRGG